MFFLVSLEKDISLHPKYFSGDLKDTILQKLIRQEEGKTSVRYGYIVSIIKIINVGKGKIDETGFATFTISFQAISFRPFKNEVIDAQVTNVTQVGIFANVGPFGLFISQHQLSEDMKFEPDSKSYISIENPSAKIETGRDIRVKIIGIAFEDNQLYGTATMKHDFLGPI